MNVNIGQSDAAAFYGATFPATYYDKMFNQANDATPKRIYTVVNCITDATNANTYVKLFTVLDENDASNITLDTTAISVVTHPLNTMIGFD